MARLWQLKLKTEPARICNTNWYSNEVCMKIFYIETTAPIDLFWITAPLRILIRWLVKSRNAIPTKYPELTKIICYFWMRGLNWLVNESGISLTLKYSIFFTFPSDQLSSIINNQMMMSMCTRAPTKHFPINSN